MNSEEKYKWIEDYWLIGKRCGDCPYFYYGSGGADPSECGVWEKGLEPEECPALEDHLDT